MRYKKGIRIDGKLYIVTMYNELVPLKEAMKYE